MPFAFFYLPDTPQKTKLYKEAEIEPIPFTLNISADTAEDVFAAQIRSFLSLTNQVLSLSRTSGICNDMSQDKAQISQMELFCNKIAGLALVPTMQLKQNKNISLIRQYGFDDIYVNALARDFAVSKEVVLHRLWDIGIIERTTYFDILNRYSEEYMAYKKSKTVPFLPY